MQLSLKSVATLNNGRTMPLLSLGVWKMSEGKETEDAVRWALEAGYRHIDTAKIYGNERSVGSAVRKFVQEREVPRKEIFVTTKLWPLDFLNPEKAFEESFKRLGLEYIDLYLIHWPAPLMPKKVWQTLERVYESGLARSIGVSNYGEDDIEKMLQYAKVRPMVNQVPFNPANHDFDLVQFCKYHNIVVEAYSPLGRGSLVRDKTVATIAEQYDKTPAQVLIRWALQHDTAPLPKSSNQGRIKENTEVFDFELSNEDMKKLNSLG